MQSQIMKNSNNLPYSELKKFGIMTPDNQFTERLSKQEQENFLNGSTLIAEDDKTRLYFQLSKGNSELKVDAFQKDIVAHRDLSSGEQLEIATTDKVFYKSMADYGKITAMGKTHLNENPRNEITYFVELENERGKTAFYGNDLADKLADYKIGDKVQVEQTGIEKKNLQVNIDGNIKDVSLYNNLFKVTPHTQENKEVRSKLFEYDPEKKTIVDMDTSDYEYGKINGVKLDAEKIKNLKKGMEVEVDEETTVQLSPKASNPARMTSNNKGLLLVSIGVDGGMSYLLVKGVQRLHRMIKEREHQTNSAKYKAELEHMKKFLETKVQQYPRNKEIVGNLNIVGKELSDVKTRRVSDTKQQKNDTSVRLDVNDSDIYRMANQKEKRTEKEERKQERAMNREERPRSRGRGR